MTKTRIQHTAKSLFLSNGLKSVSIDDICYTIGIAKKTFYIHYTNKDNLVLEFVDNAFATLHHNLHPNTLPPDAISKLKIFDDHILNFFNTFSPLIISDLKRYHNQAWQIFLNNRSKLITHLTAIINLGIEQGTFRPNLNTTLLAQLRFTEIETAFTHRPTSPPTQWLNHHQHIFDHYLAGLLLTH